MADPMIQDPATTIRVLREQLAAALAQRAAMSPEMKTLAARMGQADLKRGGPIVGFDIEVVRSELSALRHADVSREDTNELISMLDWLLTVVAEYDGVPDRIGCIRRVHG